MTRPGARAPTASHRVPRRFLALLAPDGTTEWLARPEDHARVPTRMNDGACDPHGRFWAGSMP
ncbi:SMP-30/gluconolactonase/LRE family protein, partial [Kitasatospora sp. NPDC058406]|uniref:SMP-30/gluconolactonase/LRE family protein n=1 Tax=Kitasatospora sp. NPDC058406 TaxID=3346483 RepID=UPI003668C7DD